MLSPADAVDAIIDLLDEAIAGAANDAQRKALLDARKALAGSANGQGNNGALDKILQGNTTAALVKLEHAIADLEAAEAAGADVGVLISLLQQVMAALEAGE